MKRALITLPVLLLAGFIASAQLTLDYCLQRAHENYPLIKKYELVAKTESVSLSDINRGWLPRIGVFAQGTAQNAVSEFPDALKAMLDKTGTAAAGMSKFQYKAGIELNQTIWDGGHSKAQRAVQRAASAQSRAAIDVELYAIRERVESLYFATLLMDEQIAIMRNTENMLESNLTRMKSMVANGIATQADADMIEAQLLTVRQQLTEASGSADSYRRLLAIFINEDVVEKELTRPAAEIPSDTESHRPELTLFDRRIDLNSEQSRAVNASLMPRVGLFAQAYYGYPGFNMFESIMKRDPSFNALAGVKIAWNIDSFYTTRNSRRKLTLASEMIRTDRDLFLFNNRLKITQEQKKIEALHKVMDEDARIVKLRGSVRRAAESQLSHGIIEATALLTKITDENQAALNQSLHEIQLLQTIYQLKNSLAK